MGLSWYNGHSPQKREQVQTWLNHQWDTGVLPRPSRCIACDQTQGTIHGHLENYDEPTSYVELCITCHLVLHSRFRFPVVWQRYKQLVADGWQHPGLTQRSAFASLNQGVLAGRWPAGRQRTTAPAGTYLDQLPVTR